MRAAGLVLCAWLLWQSEAVPFHVPSRSHLDHGPAGHFRFMMGAPVAIEAFETLAACERVARRHRRLPLRVICWPAGLRPPVEEVWR